MKCERCERAVRSVPFHGYPRPGHAALDELLARPPSIGRFHAILGELDQLDGPELDAQMLRVETALANWPDETRPAGEQVLADELEPDGLFKPTADETAFERRQA